MAGGVAVLDPVAVLEQRRAVGVDQDRAERFVAGLQRLAREFDAAARRSRSSSLIATGPSLRSRCVTMSFGLAGGRETDVDRM